MRILATVFFDTTYIFLSSVFFFLFPSSQARCIHDQCKGFWGRGTEVNQPGEWGVERSGRRSLTCYFFIWFVHGLELLQQGGGSDDTG